MKTINKSTRLFCCVLLLASLMLIVRGQQQQQPSEQQLEGTNNEVSPPFVQQFEGRRHEVARLERRLDRLEFELRKSVHQMQQQQPPSPESTTSQSAGDSATASRRLIDLSERLNLVEKFITISTSKMYELEMKVKQLEKCECQMSCKLESSARTNTKSDNQQLYETEEDEKQEQQQQGNQVKRDGQVWRDKCNICSCHRGHVNCHPVHCPAPKCDNPQATAGQCCPIATSRVRFGASKCDTATSW